MKPTLKPIRRLVLDALKRGIEDRQFAAVLDATARIGGWPAVRKLIEGDKTKKGTPKK